MPPGGGTPPRNEQKNIRISDLEKNTFSVTPVAQIGPKCDERVPKATPKSIQNRLFLCPVGRRAHLHETSLFTMYNPHRGVPGMVAFSPFCHPGAGQKRKRPKRRQNGGPCGRKRRHVSKMVSKMDAKIDPKSIKNRGSGPVPAPRVPKCRFWGSGVAFWVSGGTP